MHAKFFIKCSIPFLLFPLILAMFCIIGCVEKAPQIAQESYHETDDELAMVVPSRVQVDFDSEVSNNLFRVRGKIMFLGNASIPYILINATLIKDGHILEDTKYLLMQLEPAKEHSFEICKNMRIMPGSYNCTLDLIGPKGSLAHDTRKCRVVESLQSPISMVSFISPEELITSISEQELREEKIKRAANQETFSQKVSEEKDPQRKDTFGTFKSNSLAKNESKPESEADERLALNSENISKDEYLQVRNDIQQNRSAFQTKASSEKSVSLPKGDKDGLIASGTSKKYHRLGCRYASKIKPENRIYFESVEDATKQGYLPCKVCYQ